MHKPLLLIFRMIAFLALGGVCLGADKKSGSGLDSLPKPPPQPVEQSVKVPRGLKLPITLRIYGSQRERLNFLIRKEPIAGKLSPVQPRERESALVIYTPPADLQIVQDRFSYAVQNSAGVSASVEVQIAIVDDAPKFTMPDTLDFGRVLLGKSEAREMQIANRGGGVLEGEVLVDEPWGVEGKADYRLGPGEEKTFQINYQPTKPGAQRGEVRFSSDRTRVVALRAEGLAPVSVEPATIVLAALPGETSRQGSFQLINNTEGPVSARLQADSVFEVPGTVEIPAGGRTPVSIRTTGGPVAAISQELSIEAAGSKIGVPVRAPVLGPVLKVKQPAVKFTAPGTFANVELENAGGTSGTWTWKVTGPFVIQEPVVNLAAGQTRQSAIQLDPAASGLIRETLKLAGEQQEIAVAAEANIQPPAESTRPAPVPAADRNAGSARKGAPSLRKVNLSSEERVGGPGLLPKAPLTEAEVSTIKKDRIVATWSAVGSGKYRVQQQRLAKSKTGLVSAWTDVSGVEFSTQQNRVTANVTGLQPGTGYVMRVIDAADTAQNPAVITTFRAITPIKNTYVIFTPLRGLVVLLASLVGAIIWQRRRHV